MIYNNKIIFLFIAYVSLSVCLNAQSNKDVFEKVDFLMINDRYDHAIKVLDDYLKNNPGASEARYKKANCLLNIASFELAISELEKLILLDKGYIKSYEMLGILYSELKKYSKAVENYEIAYQSTSSIDQKLAFKLKIIQILYNSGKYSIAKSHIEDAKKIDSTLFDLNFFEGKYYNKIGEYEKSLPILERVVSEIYPRVEGNEKYIYEYALALHYSGDYEKAQDLFESIVDNVDFKSKIELLQPEFYLKLAQQYYQLFLYDNSSEALAIVDAMSFSNKESILLRSKLKSLGNDNSNQIALIEKTLKETKNISTKNLSDLHYKLALVHYQNGDYLESFETSGKSLEMNPYNIEALYVNTICSYNLSIVSEESEKIRYLIQSDKTSPVIKSRFSFLLGLVYKKVGATDNSIEYFRKSLIGPFSEASIYELTNLFKIKQREDFDITQGR